jgi:hypothetical protein
MENPEQNIIVEPVVEITPDQKIKELEAELEALKTLVVEPVVESVVEQVVEPLVESVVEQVVEPIVEQVVEPTIESVIDNPFIEHKEEETVPKVIQNSDTLYKSSIQWANNIEYVEPNAYEIEMLRGTKKADEIIEEEQVEEIVIKSEEEIKKQKTKDFLLIFKVVSLNRLGRNPILNTSTLQPHELKEFLQMMNLLVDDYNKGLEIEITKEFNKICIEKLFINTTDVSTFPVYA